MLEKEGIIQQEQLFERGSLPELFFSEDMAAAVRSEFRGTFRKGQPWWTSTSNKSGVKTHDKMQHRCARPRPGCHQLHGGADMPVQPRIGG